MGWFSSKDPVQAEIKELKREKADLQVAALSEGPKSQAWKAAETRNKEINREIRKLEKGR